MKKNVGKNKGNYIPSVKLVSKSIREYKKPAMLAPLFVAFEVILECLIPWIMTLLLEALDYIAKGGTGIKPQFLVEKILFMLSSDGLPDMIIMVLFFGLLLLLCAFLSLLFGVWSAKCSAIAAGGFAKNIRKDMFYRIQDFSFTNIDNFTSSSLITRLTTDVTNVEMAFMTTIRTAVRSPFMLVFALTMSFIINYRIALIFLCTIPILATGLVIIMIKGIPFFNRIFKKYDRMNQSVEENVNGMRVVKSYVREDYEKEKFNKASDDVKTDFTKVDKLISLCSPLMNFCVYFGIIAIYVVGSLLIIKSNSQLLKWTEIQSFMTYSFQMLMSLMMLAQIMVMMIMSSASVKRIAEVMTEKSTIKSPSDPVTEVKDGSVEFENVCFKYSDKAEKYSLSNINLKIKSGQTVGIIGSTGSSKTSLVNLIPRLYDANCGTVKVGGIDVKNYDLKSLRDSVSCVLQKNVLFSGTLKENMIWGNKHATDEEIHHALDLAQIGDFSLDKKIEQSGSNVSGGQKQRLCIARALLKKPKILILDDSTSAVDTKTDALIRKSFTEYIPDTTKIIIAQRISSVQDANLIVIMDNGEIVAEGTHKQLLESNKIYQELYYSQNKAGDEL